MKAAMALLVSAALMWSACAGPVLAASDDADAVSTMPLSYKPPANTDEGGLWMLSKQAEQQVRESPRLVKAPALNAYVQSVVCKIAGDYCPSIRVYIVDVPAFNASMSPNGMMLVYTGTLLRAENEAQLAFVLAHEFAHYKLRHTLERYRKIRDSAGAMMVLTIATAGIGTAILSSLTNLAAFSGLLAYTRDQERQADAYGFDYATASGYDPHAAVQIWKNLLTEEKADPRNKEPSPFLSTHPATEERLQAMKAKAKAITGTRKNWIVNAKIYQAHIRPFRDKWLAETVVTEDCDSMVAVLQRMIGDDPKAGDLQYFLGETYRRRGTKDDLTKAIAAYKTAIAEGGAPIAVYRGLGIAAMKAGDKDTARSAFDTYIARIPDADDKAMVAYYRSRL